MKKKAKQHASTKTPTITKEGRLALFERDLTTLLNRHSLENFSNTPDFVLARYLITCLDAFNEATNHRKKLRIGSPLPE
jgi:hypothetical protein